MQVDVPTLLSYTTVLIALFGGVFTYFWSREKREVRLIWFAMPFLMALAGTAMTINPALKPGEHGLRLSAFFLVLAYGFAWQAARALYRRKPLLLAVLLPSLLWLGLATALSWNLPLLTTGFRFVLLATFSGLAAYEFWRGKDEDLPSRRVVFRVFCIVAVLNAVRIPVMAITPMPIGIAPTEVWAVVLYNLASVVFLLMATTFMITLARERLAAYNYGLALRDAMTGVYNRRAYFEHVEALATRGEGATPPFALIVFDIDSFKAINDTFGHQTGDEVIILAAQAAVASLRKHDKVFRMGGEEFACLLPDTDLHEAHSAAERIRTVFQQIAATLDGKTVGGTISLGVAASNGDITPERLFIEADGALYAAKNSGRNRTFGMATDKAAAIVS